MRVSRQEAERNRERVVQVASEQFRLHGFEGIGIADLMKVAGLTHGGFYKQFASKADLEAQALAQGLSENAAVWTKVMDGKDNPLDSLLRFYLSDKQLETRRDSCVMAALGVDAAREGEAVKDEYAKGVSAHLDQLQGVIAGETDVETRKAAMSTLAQMVGALVLARGVGDSALALEILDASRDDLKARRA